jgi:hypothetical protein
MARLGGSLGRGVGVLASAALLIGAAVSVVPAAGKALTKKKADARYVNVGEKASDANLLDGTDGGAFALESEVLPTVLDGDGDGSGLDADTFDGFESATASGPGVVYVSDASGQLPNSTVSGESIANVGRAIPVPLHELDPAFSNGTPPAKALVGDAPALAFDQSTDETINFAVRMPNDVTPGQISLNLLWSSTATTGSVIWAVTIRALDSAEVVDAGGFTASVLGDSFAGSPAKRRNEVTIELGSAPLQIEARDLLVIRLSRSANSDTMAADANLHAIELRYPADQ